MTQVLCRRDRDSAKDRDSVPLAIPSHLQTGRGWSKCGTSMASLHAHAWTHSKAISRVRDGAYLGAPQADLTPPVRLHWASHCVILRHLCLHSTSLCCSVAASGMGKCLKNRGWHRNFANTTALQCFGKHTLWSSCIPHLHMQDCWQAQAI
ncbi:hypothetical protein ABBQ38_001791 [Trebouxia sp. C0009 RCD-2024]